MTLLIRPVKRSDASWWEQMRYELWPGEDEEHGKVIAAFFAKTIPEPQAVLIAETGDGRPVGFAELSIRTDLQTLEGQNVGYIEGLYVTPEMQWRGVARTLLTASRTWAHSQRCSAFASDRQDRVIIDRSFAVRLT